MKENILGFAVDGLSIKGCVDSVFDRIRLGEQGPGCTWLACLNPHSFAVALDDHLFAKALHAADYLVPDGVGVVIASKLLGGRITERVTGSDVFFGLHERMNAAGGMRVFFLGATEETLSLIRERMARDYPNIEVAGTYSPPFKPTYSPEEVDTIIDAVDKANVDVLWVGMTAPKQEKWIFENRARLKVKFAGAIGAVFDFYTGRVKRSHPAFQRMGLEWLPRLLQQPRRLWRRMFVSAPIFMWHVLKQRIEASMNNEETRT